MTAARNIRPSMHDGEVGVHSLLQFVLAVPDLKVAEQFYSDFGRDRSAFVLPVHEEIPAGRDRVLH